MGFTISKFNDIRTVVALFFLLQFTQQRSLTYPQFESSKNFNSNLEENNILPQNQRKLSQQTELKDLLLTTYFTTEQFEDWLSQFMGRCGDIARKFSIGKSVENRELWVIEISDRPGVSEPEPNVKYIGNIHGNEPSARQILPQFAEYLCENYKVEGSDAKKIVDGMHLYLLPVINPDGFESEYRNNINGYDLNRNFPDQYKHSDDFWSGQILDFEQPETRAIHEWSLQTHFVSSIGFHEGAFVVNYPLDGLSDLSTDNIYNKSPDDETFQHLSKQYAQSNDLIMRDYQFPSGITNGALWYPIYGGMQDWNYLIAKCFELTIEVYSPKTTEMDEMLLPTILKDIWESNLQGLINFAKNTTFGGVYGFVYDNSGNPLQDAIVQVKDIDWDLPVKNEFGGFWRPLAPGTYVVIVKKQGFKDFEDFVSVPEDGSGKFLEVFLERAESLRS